MIIIIAIMLSGETLAQTQTDNGRTFVPDHPNLYAASFATNSPNPSIKPFTKGNSRFMAAPLINPHRVGGLYKIMGEEDEEGGEEEERSLCAS